MSVMISFIPGSGSACVKDRLVVLTDRPVTDPLILQVWAAADAGGGIDELVGVLLSQGMATAPDFAIAAIQADGSVRAVARGGYAVSGQAQAGDFHVRARGILTDAVHPGLVSCQLGAADAGADVSVPLVGGLVPAAAVLLRATAGSTHSPREEPFEASGALAQSSQPPATVESATSPEPDAPEPTAREVTALAPTVTAVSPAAELDRREVGSAWPPSPEPVGEADPPAAPAARDLFRNPIQAPIAESTPVAADLPLHVPAAVDLPPSIAHHHEPEVAPYAAEPPPASGRIIESIPMSWTVPAAMSPASAESAQLPSAVDASPSPNASSPHSSSPPATDSVAAEHPAPPRGERQRSAPVSAGQGSADPAPAARPGGMTVNRATLPGASPVLVWAARCPVGHPSQAFATRCRVCDAPMPPDAVGQEIPRPLLGRLVLPLGPPVDLDGDLVLGREPRQVAGRALPMRAVVLNDPRREVSGQHATITLNFWDVCLTDLGSTNGTEVVTPDGRRQRLVPHQSLTILPRTRIILAEVFEMTFEAT